MQQVGGSVGTALLSTIAASATTSYAAAHHVTNGAGRAVAATHGYTVAFDVAAGLFALGAVLAVTMLPSRAALERIRQANDAATTGSAGPATESSEVVAEPVHSGV
jgi:hypothetical protein